MHSFDNKITLQGLRNGDMDVFEEVYLRFNKPVYGMAYRYLRNHELAEDAVQDVFIKLWDNRKNLDCEKSLHGFLFSALKNHVLNMLKSNSRRVLRNYEYICHTENTGDNPENSTVESDYDQLLEKALGNLHSTKRDIFNLKRLNGLSNEEISTQLGLSSNTVKSHLYQARKFIHSYVKKYSD
ncbi:MAG: RNA polymerase sigma-70 factor [Balneolales bacterium]